MNALYQYLKEHTLLADGAMGTYYGEKYQGEDILVEKANLRFPDRIKQIHLEYLQAGARLLRTNTFAVNSGFFDSLEEMKDCIQAGYGLAQEAKEVFLEDYEDKENAPQIFVAADIGTIYDLGQRDQNQVLQEYKYLVDAFAEVGAKVFLLETQADIFYIPDIVSYIKEQVEDAFVAVTFSMDKTGYTKAGLRFERMVRLMCDHPQIDAYGLNCGVEANHMYQMFKNITFPRDKFVIAMPNAGYPFQLRGKTFYGKNAAYYGNMLQKIHQLGIDVLGGCCGTSPEYFTQVYETICNLPKQNKHIGKQEEPVVSRTESDFWKKLQAGEMPFVVELDPPSGIAIEKLQEGAQLLKEHRVDLLTLSDSPMARSRMDASLLGQKLQKETGIFVMPHISCRDRNIISLRGTMLGDYINDIKHFLVVTGDPVAKNDRSTISQVFDYNSIKFMGLLKEMNQDEFQKDCIVYGGALNYHGANPDAIANRMKQKMEQGCSFFLTQPVYSQEDIERLAYLREKTGAKILGGIMPLVSRKNALFLENEMPGIHIPKDIIDAYEEGCTREEYEQTATEISVDIAKSMKEKVDGFYFMTPFNRVSLICNIIEEIRKQII